MTERRHTVRLVVATAGGGMEGALRPQAPETGVTIEVLRGRITPEEARLEIELSGTPRQVRDALAVFRANGVVTERIPGNRARAGCVTHLHR